METTSAFRIVQISDIHLLADIQGALLGVKTQDSFLAVVDLLRQQEKKLDLIILSGDLSQDGSIASYQRIAESLKDLHVPIYFVPGNHDDPKTLSHVYPCQTISSHKHIVLKDWHIILLNSQKPGAVEGHLDQSELNYLQHCLQTYPEHRALVFFHHHPVKVGAQWLDNLGLTNANEFWEIAGRYPKLHTVFFGHVHQESEHRVNNIPCFSPPSTCIQFKPHQDNFGLDHIPQGYRWIELSADGNLKTGITRLSQYVGVFDENAKGY